MNIKDTKWVTLFGRVSVKNSQLKYEPKAASRKGGPAPVPEPPGVIKSNLYFEDGVIQVRTRLGDPICRLQIVLGHGTERQIFAGVNGADSYAYGITVWESTPTATGVSSGGAWKIGETGGIPGTIPSDRDIEIQVRVLGSTVILVLDGVEVAKLNVEVPRSQIALMFFGGAQITAELVAVKSNRPMAFVVMQFTDEFNSLYQDVIKPTCEKFGYEVVRGDDVYNNGLIIEDISRSIRESSLIVADITPKNPNVYYEVGFAHAIGKPTILMAERKLAALPFDVAGFRTIFYDDSIGGKAKVEERLAHHLEAVSNRVPANA